MNRLSQETSPYLLQHKHNPVDWYPWCAEALERARQEDKPIFLSIGYSACHWCHVMERESFENEALAALLNRHFVCIKVDREERPDLDHIYMQAVQMLTGRGGWPLSAFLTPGLEPFYGGTYWPPTQRLGMPGFDQVIRAVADAWMNRREQAVAQARQLTEAIGDRTRDIAPADGLSLDSLDGARQRLAAGFDPVHGGFGRAPKFPRPVELQLLLRIWHRGHDRRTLDMVCLTLDKMACGGMYDHLGGGFARYSVDERWLVPHFEKMLYDNALLADAYLDGYLATGAPRYRRVVEETLDYVLRDLMDPQQGFHGTEDADSEGEEGKYYVWSRDEILQVLGSEPGALFCDVYGVTAAGNFEGRNILHLAEPLEQTAAARQRDPDEFQAALAEARRRLLEQRQQRVRPGRDDKILVSWNALMIHSLARAAGVLAQPTYLRAAQRAAHFVLTRLRRADGRLLHCWRQGSAKLDAYLDDYAYLANALITLYEADFDEHWIDQAAALADTMLARFTDREQGGFYFTADDHESLVVRTQDWFDASVPSGNAMAATALVRLGKLTGRQDYLAAATGTLEAAAAFMQSTPEGVCQLLVATDLLLGPTWELVLRAGSPGASSTADDTTAALQAIRHNYLPRRLLACRQAPGAEGYRSSLLDDLFAHKPAAAVPCLYACQNFTCQAPLEGLPAIQAWLEAR